MVASDTKAPARRHVAVGIVVFGLLVAAAPVVWAPLVFTDWYSQSAAGDVVLIAITVVPFGLLAGLVLGPLSRTAAILTLVPAAAATVFFQYDGLDPNGTSTAPIILVFGPFELALAICFVLGLDVLVRAVTRRLRHTTT